MGHLQEALAAINEAVAIRRKLAAAHPDAFETGLAESLSALADVLEILGKRKEATVARDEAFRLREQLLGAQRGRPAHVSNGRGDQGWG